MTAALTLLIVQGVLGALDTLWYHEIDQRLPSRPNAARELRLHAARDFAYAALFAALAWAQWHGLFAALLAALLLAEIVITLCDFIEEDRHRPLPPGERVMHTVLAIIYGAFLASLVPEMWSWWQAPTGIVTAGYGRRSWLLTAMSAGVFAWGVRDMAASFGSSARGRPAATR
jgi:hypothetical protein